MCMWYVGFLSGVGRGWRRDQALVGRGGGRGKISGGGGATPARAGGSPAKTRREGQARRPTRSALTYARHEGVAKSAAGSGRRQCSGPSRRAKRAEARKKWQKSAILRRVRLSSAINPPHLARYHALSVWARAYRRLASARPTIVS